MKTGRETHSFFQAPGFASQVSFHVPLSSLQWLLGGLLLAALPLMFQTPEILLGFLGCLIWRFVIERSGRHIPPSWVRLVVGVVGVLTILGVHGNFFNLVACMGLLLLLVALKVLEMRTEREFMLLAFLAYFILLTALFFTQTLLTCVYVGAVFVVLTGTLIHFTSGSAKRLDGWPLVRYAGVLLLKALPIIIILFFFVPRPRGDFILKFKREIQAQSGISDQMNPGTFSELVLTDEVVFRADFPTGDAPPLGDLYWRVAVFSECHGLAWRRSAQENGPFPSPQFTGRKIVQRVTMPQQNGRQVYALDRPLSVDGPATLTSGGILTLNRDQPQFFGPLIVTSQLGNDRTPIASAEWALVTTPPENVGPRVRQLVNRWQQKTREPREIVQLALAYFRTEKFRYTLNPGTYANDALEEFLFERKRGFCEHFAASFATLMRVAGIPSRVVAGYHGGEYNPLGSYFTIRQANAHAWAEIWLAGRGWVRYDISEAVDPAFIDPSTQLATRHGASSTEPDADTAAAPETSIWSTIATSARFAWDAANYQWNLRILGFDQTMQRDLYSRLGINGWFSWKLMGIFLAGIALVAVIATGVLRPKAERRDNLLCYYRRFCKDLAQAGTPRRPNEGPLDYSRRLAAAYPEKSEAIESLAKAFIQARYGYAIGRQEERRFALSFKQLRDELLKRSSFTTGSRSEKK